MGRWWTISSSMSRRHAARPQRAVPAATSSLAIGELIADAAQKAFALDKVAVAV
jgi:hypothetical protein